MAVYEIEGIKPDMHASAYVADSAQVMGNVTLAADSSIWFGAIVRGDNDNIHVGEGSNIQDGSVLHSDVGKPLHIGKHVTVGHMVMLHGCSVDDGCLIGIGAVILNEAKIGKNCMFSGQVGIVGHLTIADNTIISAQSGISKSVTHSGAVFMGSPAFEASKYRKSYVHFRNLDSLAQRVNKIEKQQNDNNKS